MSAFHHHPQHKMIEMTELQAARTRTRHRSARKPGQGNKSIRWVRTLHIYTSMLMLLVMLFFTVTGLTLNHREWLPEAPDARISELLLPGNLSDAQQWQATPLAQAEQVRRWLQREHGVAGNQVAFDWQPDEQLLMIDVKRPGGYSLAEVLPEEGVVLLEQQSYGAAAVLNDLHMGRYSGALWRAFIDLSALLMLLFTLTGLWLVMPQKKRRQRLLWLSGLGGVVMTAGYLLILMN